MACNNPKCLNCRVNAILDEFFPGGVTSKESAAGMLALARDIAGAVLSDPHVNKDSIHPFFTAVRVEIARREGVMDPKVTIHSFGDSLQDLLSATWPLGIGVDEIEIALPAVADLLGFMFARSKSDGLKAAFYQMVERHQAIHEAREAVSNAATAPSTGTVQ